MVTLDAMIGQLNDKAPDARWIFVGDLIDHGEHSAEVLNRIRALEVTRPNTVVILGNHEEAGNRWMRHGGLQTMASYGALHLSQNNPPEALRQAHEHLLNVLPAGLEDWLSTRPRVFQSGNVVVVHAGADPSLPIEDQKDQALT
jgi:serine/threonine protein phosphatase 1